MYLKQYDHTQSTNEQQEDQTQVTMYNGRNVKKVLCSHTEVYKTRKYISGKIGNVEDAVPPKLVANVSAAKRSLSKTPSHPSNVKYYMLSQSVGLLIVNQKIPFIHG